MDNTTDLQILPIEVWHIILDSMRSSPRDLRKLCHASLFFREILENDRVYFLFPKVINILMKIYLGKRLESQNLEDQRATVVAYARRHDNELTKSILNCRLVCTLWNDAVLKCYERPQMTGITPFIEDVLQRRTITKPFLGNEIFFSFRFHPEKIDRFRKTFQDSHHEGAQKRNPFLGRHLRFDVVISDRRNDKEFIDEITETLRMFGQHIWYVTLVFVVSIGNVAHIVDAYLTLVKWLNLMPNLKYLCIQLNAYEARKLISRFVDQNPVPKLSELLFLETHLLTGPILQDLITKNNHVPYFRINSSEVFDRPISAALPNLKAVGVRYTGGNQTNLINYIGGQCRLEILHLHEQYDDFDFTLNFELMHKYWSQTLVDLTLDISHPEVQAKLVEDSKLWRLNLPQLQRLSLRIFGVYFLDFILPLKNLRTLEIMTICIDHVDYYETYKERVVAEQEIEYMGFEKKLNKSNIWDKLPKLQNIKVTFGGHFGDPVTYFEYNKRHLMSK